MSAVENAFVLARLSLLAVILVLATVADQKSRRIPNVYTYSGLLLVLALSVLEALCQPMTSDALRPITRTLLGILACGIPLLMAYRRGGVGGGDVKLAGVIGGFLGAVTGVQSLLAAHLLACIYALSKKLCASGWAAGWRKTCQGDYEKRSEVVDARDLCAVPMALFYGLGVGVMLLCAAWK